MNERTFKIEITLGKHFIIKFTIIIIIINIIIIILIIYIIRRFFICHTYIYILCIPRIIIIFSLEIK